MRLTVTGLTPKQRKNGSIVQGTNAAAPWTMFAVTATDEHGPALNGEDIITFQDLPVGSPIEVEVETKDHPQYGRSHTIKQAKGSNGYTPPADQALADENVQMQLDRLRERVDALSAAFREMGGFTNAGTGTDFPIAESPKVPVPADDDIPPF